MMRIAALTVLLSAVTLTACSGEEGPSAGASGAPTADRYGVVDAFPALSFSKPVDLQNAGDGSGRLFVVEQAGRIRVTDGPSSSTASTFLDIVGMVNSEGYEEGLLGLAFDPDYPNTPNYFIYYTVKDQAQRKSRVSRFTVDAQNPNVTQPGSRVDVISIDQPFQNHNGGQLAFGPDGYLYIGVGDGGSANDPNGNGQNRRALLGKILRLDVSVMPYAIPPDNPFAGNTSGYREEIYAYGVRNPWRFSFDPVTQWLWVADVGQNAYEEIDIVHKGGNYGWNIMEASACRPPTRGCNTAGLELPVWEYAHDGSPKSITGGHVYRGSALPELVGAYIYADFMSGQIWALRYDGVDPPQNELIVDAGLPITSFGVDEANELLLCGMTGKIYKIEKKTKS